MTTAILDSEIVFCRETRDYDILIANVICASAATYSAAEAIRTRLLAERRDEGLYATASELDDEPTDDDPEAVNWNSRAPVIVPNPGLHLSSYTVYDRPGQHGSRAVHLCDDCAAKRRANGTMASKWSGECINGYCDDCGAGPSVSHFRLADDPPPAPPVDDGPADNWGGFRAAVPEGTDPNDFSDVGPDAGRAIGRQWLRDRARFLTMLSNLDRDAWQLLAAAYCAWMNRGGCGLEVAHVLLIWRKAVERDIALPPKAA